MFLAKIPKTLKLQGSAAAKGSSDVAAQLDALFRDGDGDVGEGEEEEEPDQGEDDEVVDPLPQPAGENSSDALVVKSWPESKAELLFSNKKGLVLKSHGRRKSLKLKDHVLVEIEGGQVQLTAAPDECGLQWKLIKATKLLFVSGEGRKCLKMGDILKQKNVQTVYGHALASGHKIGPLKDGKQAARPCLGNSEQGPEVQNFAWLCPHEKKAWWKAGAAASKCFGSLGFWPRRHHHYIRNTHLRRRMHLYFPCFLSAVQT